MFYVIFGFKIEDYEKSSGFFDVESRESMTYSFPSFLDFAVFKDIFKLRGVFFYSYLI